MERGLQGRIFNIELSSDPNSEEFDCVVFVSENLDFTDSALEFLKEPLTERKKNDSSFEKEISFIDMSAKVKRLVYSPTGPVNRDYDDIRRYYDAACNGMKRAVAAGSKKPVFAIPAKTAFENAWTVSSLGALHGLYTPIEVAVADEEKAKKVEKLSIYYEGKQEDGQKSLDYVKALEVGRTVCRDIASSDPEFSCTTEVEKYVKKVLDDPNIKITVTSGTEVLTTKYPLLAKVNRAAIVTERHQGRVIDLEYNPPTKKSIDVTLMLVGKGVAYDTGGADIKTGGHMPGMNRDKSGAAAVAGFFKILSILKPSGIRVRGSMAMVRNSVGPAFGHQSVVFDQREEEMYVADEIVTAASGVRIRVINTDAEGRFAMADPLFHMKEEALKSINPVIFTMATLTGHVIRSYGPAYSGIMENGPAKEKKVCQSLQEAGDMMAEPCEISTMRREDYDATKSKTEYQDYVQLETKTGYRGHQFAGAFLARASGLDKHGVDAEKGKQLPYVHVDIAGSSGLYPDMPNATPLLGLSAMYLKDRI